MKIRAWIVASVLCLGAAGVPIARAQPPEATDTTTVAQQPDTITEYRSPTDKLARSGSGLVILGLDQVTGIGASKRVVVWDNTSRDMTDPETMFVFGHEQGHYVLNHIWLSITFLVVGLLIAMYLAYRLIGGVLDRFGARWGIRDLGNWASLPALMLLLSLVFLIVQPIAAGFSRHLERQADIYGLEVIHGLVPDSPRVAAQAFQKLGEKALSYPNPNALFVLWTYDHPPVSERVRLALDYRPWDVNAPTRYVE